MAGYASAQPRTAVYRYTFATGVDLCSKYRIKANHSTESHAHHARHICSHGNSDIFTVIETINCYQNILVYLALAHMHNIIMYMMPCTPII